MSAAWSGSAIIALGGAISIGVTAVVILVVALSVARRRRQDDGET